jgi:hypothetical protein
MEKKNSNSGNNKLVYIVGGVAFAIIAVLVIFMMSQQKEHNAIKEEMMEEKLILTEEFQDLALDYDSLYSNNDTLNLMLEEEREKITNLIEEIKTIKATNARKIREYKKELTTMRGVMRNFVVQIDSLNRRNVELTEENKKYRKQYNKVQESFKELEKEKDNLATKVEIASKLETKDIVSDGLNPKGKVTRKARSTAKIRVCFTVLKNVTATVGMKTAYVRIMRPDDVLLLHSRDDIFEYEGEDINFSASREFEYGSEDLDVCVYYNADEGELLGGKYTVDLFVDGFNIGTGTFELK